MIINILHLYFDLMNLYGESGNVKALTYALNSQNIKVNIDRLSINDKIDFKKYDLIYLGSSTNDNLLIALENMKKYKKNIKEYIESDKFILATGNSIELFGSKINDIDALNIFEYKAIKNDKRIVGDYIKEYNKIKLLAFQNRENKIVDNSNLFIDEEVGINYKNFYGTYLIGPILVRNPELTNLFIKKLINSKDKKFKFKKIDFKLEEKAKETYLKNYY